MQSHPDNSVCVCFIRVFSGRLPGFATTKSTRITIAAKVLGVCAVLTYMNIQKASLFGEHWRTPGLDTFFFVPEKL